MGNEIIITNLDAIDHIFNEELSDNTALLSTN